MAKVSKRVVDTVFLELDIHEAKVLRTIVGRIGGKPDGSDRGVADSIMFALEDGGIEQYPWYRWDANRTGHVGPDYPQLNGSLTFTDSPKRKPKDEVNPYFSGNVKASDLVVGFKFREIYRGEITDSVLTVLGEPYVEPLTKAWFVKVQRDTNGVKTQVSLHDKGIISDNGRWNNSNNAVANNIDTIVAFTKSNAKRTYPNKYGY